MMYSYIPLPDMAHSGFRRTIIDAFHCFGKSGLWVGVLWCGVVWCGVVWCDVQSLCKIDII